MEIARWSGQADKYKELVRLKGRAKWGALSEKQRAALLLTIDSLAFDFLEAIKSQGAHRCWDFSDVKRGLTRSTACITASRAPAHNCRFLLFSLIVECGCIAWAALLPLHLVEVLMTVLCTKWHFGWPRSLSGGFLANNKLLCTFAPCLLG